MEDAWDSSLGTDVKILCVPKNLEVGGSQINALQMAVALAQRGHEVIIASSPGPLTSQLGDEGVLVTEIPPAESRWGRLAALSRLKREHEPEVIHAYEVRTIMDCCFTSQFEPHTPVLGTIMSTRVPWYLPESVPITVGVPNVAEFTGRWRSGRVVLIEPPIPEPPLLRPGDPTRQDAGDPESRIVLVSRLVEPFKREGILGMISAMRVLGRSGFRLDIVGDGPARPLFEQAAEFVSGEVGTSVISFRGATLDPQAAIEFADVVVGSGVSVIQGVMLGKPAVVIGRAGYSAVVSRESLTGLIDRGFYGVGNGQPMEDVLPAQILSSINTARKAELTMIADEIRARYGISAIAERFEAELRLVRVEPPPNPWEMSRSLARAAHYRARRGFFRLQAQRLGLKAEVGDNFVYGRLRNLALPPSTFATGRNRPS